MKICVLPGDGIGPEITAEAVRVLRALDLNFEMEEALLGGTAVSGVASSLREVSADRGISCTALLPHPARQQTAANSVTAAVRIRVLFTVIFFMFSSPLCLGFVFLHKGYRVGRRGS